ncbi:MAG: HIT family protein [Lactovum sp.]
MCVFCDIVTGKSQSIQILEGNYCKVIYDINPISPGHSLVISKEHYSELKEVPDEEILEMMQMVKKIYPVLVSVYQADGLSLIENYGYLQEIKHTHFHLIPLFKESPNFEIHRTGRLEKSKLKLVELKKELGLN